MLDQAGEDIKGLLYSKELQKVTKPESYRIEKVIRKKRDLLESGNLLYKVERTSWLLQQLCAIRRSKEMYEQIT